MSWSQAMRLCSIRSTIGSSPCPFLVRNVASSCSLTFPCLRIVWYVFFTAVLPSRFGNPILRNQAEPPLNFQLWLGHPRQVILVSHICEARRTSPFQGRSIQTR